MNFGVLSPEEERMTFINSCIVNDEPRMKTIVFPEGVDVMSDIPYIDDGLDEHKFDIYTKKGTVLNDEAFFVIHGGAFVYGYKKLDQDYSMNLVKASGIPAINTNYRLMPGVDLKATVSDLCSAINFANSKYGVKKFHITGDSAGGYLAIFMTCIIRSEKIRNELGFKINNNIEVVSLSPICACLFGRPDCFPMCYFTLDDSILPSYIYKLYDLIEMTGLPRTAIATGDKDFLMQDNIDLDEHLTELNIPHSFYMAISREGFEATHVYPILNPNNEEGKTVISLVVNNARS